ncbi:AAA family ATPase [Dermabacteraceae bacterium TAE3-ERU27]|nr:AAA family ATPase [Dermabacteraceae bacterium TAE3-ERU27]
MSDWLGESYDGDHEGKSAIVKRAGGEVKKRELPRRRKGSNAAVEVPAADANESDAVQSEPVKSMPAKAQRSGVSDLVEVMERKSAPSSASLLEMTEISPRIPAKEGWRGAVNRNSFGKISLAASAEEISRLNDERDAGVQLSRPVTVMVANTKGGVGKTPTSANLAAILGKMRGGGVVAWDNNENQGTLGLRTEQGRFNTTTLDLLENLAEFEEGRGRLGDLGRYVRHQQAGSFDVLASAEDSRKMTAIGSDEFHRIHNVLSTFYQVIVVDTGNALLAPNWAAAADVADVLVVPVRWSQDHVISAARMFEQLAASGREELVSSAITVISHSRDEFVDAQNAPRWRGWFEESTAGVFEIPYDAHIAAGSAMRFDLLQPGTQRAYLAVAAEVSRALLRIDATSTSL